MTLMHHACFAFHCNRYVIETQMRAHTPGQPFTVSFMDSNEWTMNWVKSLRVFALFKYHLHVVVLISSNKFVRFNSFLVGFAQWFNFGFYFICFSVNKRKKIFILMAVFFISVCLIWNSLLPLIAQQRLHRRRQLQTCYGKRAAIMSFGPF